MDWLTFFLLLFVGVPCLKAVLPVIAYTEERAYFHARIWSSLDVSRKIIRAYDLIVAATA